MRRRKWWQLNRWIRESNTIINYNIANELSKSFSVSGTCTGTGNRIVEPTTTAATFEGVTGFSAVETIMMSLSAPCSLIVEQTFTAYYDNNYVPHGFNSAGVNYGVYLTPPILPSSVSVGDTGIIGTENFYTDSTKGTSDGWQDVTYVIEPDTATVKDTLSGSTAFACTGDQ